MFACSYHLAIDRRGIFYVRDLQEKFPGNHVLSKVKADDVGVLSLMDCVFIKTDVGAKMTRGSTDDVTVSGSDACPEGHKEQCSEEGYSEKLVSSQDADKAGKRARDGGVENESEGWGNGE
ncbi:hypothetical protein LSAT2_026145 [Lamellibrachia satsuma]|nr:hypothetical protein LSAT2_026145 [Lamellibrachia satsuma]